MTTATPRPGPFSRSPADRAVVALVYAQRLPLVGHVIRQFLKFCGTDIPPAAIRDSRGLVLQHGGKVTVHWSARLGNDVVLLQNCTIGRGDLWRPPQPDLAFVVEDDVIVGAGAVVLASRGTLTLGRGTVVGANAVLRQSTGPWEIWAGNPAVRVGSRMPEGEREGERPGPRHRAVDDPDEQPPAGVDNLRVGQGAGSASTTASGSPPGPH